MTGFKTLQLQYFFTAGKDEVKAWTIQKGTKAPQAAGRIHTDFEKGFIMAEVLSVSRLNFRKNAGGRGGEVGPHPLSDLQYRPTVDNNIDVLYVCI